MSTARFWQGVVGRYIKKQRMLAGLSQMDVGVHSRTAISELERGQVNFTIATLVNVLDKIGGSVPDAFESSIPVALHGPHADLHEILQQIIATGDPDLIEWVRSQLEFVLERYVDKPQQQQS